MNNSDQNQVNVSKLQEQAQVEPQVQAVSAVQDQNQVQTQQQNQAGQHVQVLTQTPIVSSQTTSVQHSTGRGQKEAEMPIVNADLQSSEITPSEHEPNLHPEVKEAGVEVISETPRITVEHQKAGIELAKESVPVKTQPTGSITLTPSQAQRLSKSGNVNDSISWLAKLLIKHFKKINILK